MKVLTKYPVYVNKDRISNADFYYNADDTLPDDAFSYTEDKPSPGGSDTKSQAIQAGIGAAATIGSTLLSRPKQPKTELEQRCGKRPKVGKKRKQRWEECAAKFGSSDSINASARMPAPPVLTLPTIQPAPDEKRDRLVKWILIGTGVLAVGVISYFIYKSMKSPAEVVTPTKK